MKNKGKRIIAVILLCSTCLLSGCSTNKFTINDKPCWWDERRPVMKLTNHDGKDVYICEKCASKCVQCDKETYTISFNMLGGPLPLCKEHASK